jgi:2-oxoglutarate dehydrogenase complex dehydrogenase (E1) component-like enzyme
VGRPPAAAVATGSKYIHNNEQDNLIGDALRI